MATTSDAIALGCLERKVRNSCGISVTGETPQSSEEAHRTPRGKQSNLGVEINRLRYERNLLRIFSVVSTRPSPTLFCFFWVTKL
ncbi:hypothetical protein [Priestia koreensis]|uniref:hypothetical protein n=1 Tax=Priestia koreensis TaxID=284581 RepID=UPI0012EED283|nr:hypothetical protein [Priestia koreensis]